MTSFADSEKRLIAALGRIDQALDRGTPAGAHTDGVRTDDAELEALRAENAALKQRLSEAEGQLAAHAKGANGAEGALQSELDRLRATRSAEIAALDEIMSGLELLIARAPRASDAPYAENVAPASGEVVAFDKSEG